MMIQQHSYQDKTKDQVQSASTQADSLSEYYKTDLMAQASLLLDKATTKGLEHHQIAARVGANTFTADKMFKFSSAVLKVMRGYKWTDNLKACEKLGGQIGQVRRFLRVDRVLMLLKEFAAFSQKKQSSASEKILILFKIMILLEDVTDLSAFLIQMKVLRGDHLLGEMRKKVAVLYFLECLGWLIYYTREFYKSKTEEDRYRNKMAIAKYFLDGMCAHNELACRLFSLDPKVTSVLSLLSGSLNLYLVWK